MNVLNEKSSLSQQTPLIVTKPPFYTCFHDVHLSLILSYQFNLLIMYIIFNRYFMSKEIHKKESRLRLLQNNDLSTQMVSFVTEIKLLFHYCIVLDILYCLLSRIRF